MSPNNKSQRLAALLAAASMIVPSGLAVAQPPRLLAPLNANGEPFSFADLVERVSPAVVSVEVEREIERQQVPAELQRFFQFRFGGPNGPQFGGPDDDDSGPETAEAQGSGFFIDAAGHVVTNNHVVEGAKTIDIRFADGTTKRAKLVGADPMTDLAVLKVEPAKNQPFVQFADDVNLRVGDWVLAVGNPFGLGGSVTSGIVSALGREQIGNRAGDFIDYIQIDAPINRGNSGGPTFDVKGRVVGVNTAIFSPNGGSVGIGFAIPANVAKDTVAQLIRSGSVSRGWLGVSIQQVTPEIASALGRKEARGALVAEVFQGSPAGNAGIQSGDLILDVNGRSISNSLDLTRTVAGLAPGSRANVRLLRNGQERVVQVALGQRKPETELAGLQGGPQGGPVRAAPDVSSDLGVRLQDLNPQIRQQLGLGAAVAGAVVTDVKRGSAAAEAGLAPGVVLLEIDGRPAANAAAAARLLDEAKKAGKDAVLVRFQAGDQKRFSALSLKK